MNELIHITNENGVPVVSSREVAEHFGKRHDHVLRAIEGLGEDLPNFGEMFFLTEEADSYGRSQKVYLLTRDGFTLLAMGFTGKEALAWKVKYIEAFNAMEQQLTAQKPTCIEDVLIQSLQEMKEVKLQIAATNKRVDDIREVVALNPNGWRDDARRLIVKIAQSWGGNEFIKDVNAEVFRLVDTRGGVSLATRLTNKRQRMAEEGVCKSKRDKLTKVDIIAEDKKLIEIYLAIVKEMAVQHNVG